MGTRFGEIDVAQIVENEFRVLVLEGIVNRLLKGLPPGTLQQSDIDDIRASVVEQLKKKYPKTGISLT